MEEEKRVERWGRDGGREESRKRRGRGRKMDRKERRRSRDEKKKEGEGKRREEEEMRGEGREERRGEGEEKEENKERRTILQLVIDTHLYTVYTNRMGPCSPTPVLIKKWRPFRPLLKKCYIWHQRNISWFVFDTV